MRIKLKDIAHGRSGDKGDAANVGIIAYDDDGYEIIKTHLTKERVKEYFTGVCLGEVDRFELPNLRALNEVLHFLVTELRYNYQHLKLLKMGTVIQ